MSYTGQGTLSVNAGDGRGFVDLGTATFTVPKALAAERLTRSSLLRTHLEAQHRKRIRQALERWEADRNAVQALGDLRRAETAGRAPMSALQVVDASAVHIGPRQMLQRWIPKVAA